MRRARARVQRAHDVAAPPLAEMPTTASPDATSRHRVFAGGAVVFRAFDRARECRVAAGDLRAN